MMTVLLLPASTTCLADSAKSTPRDPASEATASAREEVEAIQRQIAETITSLNSAIMRLRQAFQSSEEDAERARLLAEIDILEQQLATLTDLRDALRETSANHLTQPFELEPAPEERRLEEIRERQERVLEEDPDQRAPNP